jgi:hypothetical protein
LSLEPHYGYFKNQRQPPSHMANWYMKAYYCWTPV